MSMMMSFFSPVQTRSRKLSPVGVLSQPKILHGILAHLSFDDLARLGRVSRYLRDLLLQWCYSPESRPRLLYSLCPAPRNQAPFLFCGATACTMDPLLWRQNFTQLALLLKSLTCLLPTQRRLEHVHRLLDQIELVRSDVLLSPAGVPKAAQPRPEPGQAGLQLQHRSESVFYACQSLFACTFMRGWRDEEKRFAFQQAVSDALYLEEEIMALWEDGYNWGSNYGRECQIRKRLVFTFWEEVPDADRGLCLDLVLEHFCRRTPTIDDDDDDDKPTSNQFWRPARLLFLMFGPLKTVRSGQSHTSWILWDDMFFATDGNESTTRQYYAPLGRALTALNHQIPTKRLFQLIDELLSDWDVQNAAAVICNASQCVQKKYFKMKLSRNQIALAMSPEAPELLAHMLALTASFGQDLRPLFRLVENVSKDVPAPAWPSSSSSSSLAALKSTQPATSTSTPTPSVPTSTEEFLASLWQELTELTFDALETDGAMGYRKQPVVDMIMQFGITLMTQGYAKRAEDEHEDEDGGRKRKQRAEE